MKDACQYVTVPCSEEGCDQTILRKDCGKHADVCAHRSTECDGCGISVKYSDLTVGRISFFPSRSLERFFFFFWQIRIIIRNVPQRPQPAPFARLKFRDPSCKIMLLRVRKLSFLAHMVTMAVPGSVRVTSYQSFTSARVRMNR